MKTRTKALLLTLCAVLLVTASVMGTMAYLTSNDSVTNTFTVGQVKITLDEAKVNTDGTKVVDKDGKEIRVDNNTYKLMPGHKYTKDPTIHVDSSSEDCFIRAKVTLTNGSKWAAIAEKYANNQIENIIKGTDDNLWWVSAPDVDQTKDTLTYTFVYKNESKEESLKRVWQSSTDDNDLVLFTEIDVPDGLTNTELATVANTTITVVADAIQADGFAESSNDKDAAATAYQKAMEALDGAKAS